MATTTNYSWTTPDDTALVKDGAAAIRSLGSSIDTTTKALNPSTTLGDIEYRSATANTNTRLALGTAGQILTVNSGATAPEWATAPKAGGQSQYPQVTSGIWMSNFVSGTVGTSAITLNRTYYIPINVPATTLDRINVKTGSGFTGTATTRLGLYANSTSNKPSTLLLDAGTVAMSAASTNYEITISKSVDAGLIWVAINQQAQSGSPQMTTLTGANFATDGSLLGGTSGVVGGTRQLYFIQSSVTGAFADAVSPTSASSPAIMQVDLRNA